MRATHYAKALAELLSDRPASEGAAIAERLVETARKNGHAHLLPRIARAYEKIAKKNERARTVEVVTAHKSDPALVTATAKKNGVATEGMHVVSRTDATLVGGALVRTRSERIDMSYKRALMELYKKLTS